MTRDDSESDCALAGMGLMRPPHTCAPASLHCALCPTRDGQRPLAAVLAPLRTYTWIGNVKMFAGFEMLPLCEPCLLAAKTAGDVSSTIPMEIL